MIAHTTLPVSDYKKSKAFHVQALAPLAYENNLEDGEAAGFNDDNNTDLRIGRVDTIVPTHIAFEATSRHKVEAFYKSALAAGAIDNGCPGYLRRTRDKLSHVTGVTKANSMSVPATITKSII